MDRESLICGIAGFLLIIAGFAVLEWARPDWSFYLRGLPADEAIVREAG